MAESDVYWTIWDKHHGLRPCPQETEEGAWKAYVEKYGGIGHQEFAEGVEDLKRLGYRAVRVKMVEVGVLLSEVDR